MRLSKHNAQKINQLVWRDRLRRFGLAAGLIMAALGGLVWYNQYRVARSDPTVAVQAVAAVVSANDTKRAGRSGFIFHARLEDGRSVDAISTNGLSPPEGARVMLGEARHKSGKLTYDLIRVVE